MAITQALFKCAILLALITCLEILSTEGRKLMSMNKPELNSIKKDSQTETAKLGNPTINIHHNTAGHKEDFQPTFPGPIPSSVEHSMAGSKEVFTPKSGFAFGVDKESVTGFKDDFRPTEPGHSPGVGHAYQNKMEEPNA